MEKYIGVWIDHRKAVIVTITDGSEEFLTIVSGIEPHVKHPGGIIAGKTEHRFTNHLHEYYSRVTAAVHGARSIFIFGPGEAKLELEHLLKSGQPEHSEAHHAQLLELETDDKMTDHQIAAKVREHIRGLTIAPSM